MTFIEEPSPADYGGDYDKAHHKVSMKAHAERIIDDIQYSGNWLAARMAVSNSRIAHEQYAEVLKTLQPLRDTAQMFDDKVLDQLIILYGIPRQHLVLGDWACPASPTGWCIYD